MLYPIRKIANAIVTIVCMASLFCAAVLAKKAFAYDAGACYVVSSPDARAMCLAKAYHQPAYCYSIQDADKRAACIAEVRK